MSRCIWAVIPYCPTQKGTIWWFTKSFLKHESFSWKSPMQVLIRFPNPLIYKIRYKTYHKDNKIVYPLNKTTLCEQVILNPQINIYIHTHIYLSLYKNSLMTLLQPVWWLLSYAISLLTMPSLRFHGPYLLFKKFWFKLFHKLCFCHNSHKKQICAF